MNFFKNKKVKEHRNKLKVYNVNLHKKTVIVLWSFLVISFCFAVYKNFTAINIRHEIKTTVVKDHIVDTHGIENFVKNFAKVYYTWQPSQSSIDDRTAAMKNYLTDDLQQLDIDTIRKDIPTSSVVQNVQIYSIKDDGNNKFKVVFTVDQLITNNNSNSNLISAYEVEVYVNNSGSMVIIKNPTVSSVPGKAYYKTSSIESDGNIDSSTSDDVQKFLTTFFKLYPGAGDQELSYYVKDNVLKPINNNYLFAELINPICKKDGDKIRVYFSVRYINKITGASEISQFDLKLKKDGNWMIVG